MDAAYPENNSICLALAGLMRKSPRILCVVGAGLSAPSGLATWRGTSGHWRNIDLKSLASPKAFAEDPVTVWSFYGERLLESMSARPNDAHVALAALASWHDGLLTLSQNVDGLLERSGYPVSRLINIHGTLQVVRCTACDYKIHIQKPEHLPFLILLSGAISPTEVAMSDLPHCPDCAQLLRPDIVWFGESLAADALERIENWLLEEGIELVMAVGTSLNVFPAAEWVNMTRANGACLALIDPNVDHQSLGEFNNGDLIFEQDVMVVLPEVSRLLKTRWNI